MAEATISETPARTRRRKPWYTVLYIQVLIAIALGIVIGHLYPTFGTSLKPLGDAFISLVKMMIAPVIFCTVVHGIASMSDLKKIGRVGVKTLFYFEVVSTLALVIGLLVGERPAAGCWLQHRSGSARYQSGCDLRLACERRRRHHAPDEHHSQHVCQRFLGRRPATGSAGVDLHRLCDFRAWGGSASRWPTPSTRWPRYSSA